MIEFLKTSDKENIFKSKKKNDTLHIELKKMIVKTIHFAKESVQMRKQWENTFRILNK